MHRPVPIDECGVKSCCFVDDCGTEVVEVRAGPISAPCFADRHEDNLAFGERRP